MIRASCFSLAILLLAGTASLSAQKASLVEDLNSEEFGITGSHFGQLTVVKEKLFFKVDADGDSSQIWVTDGSAEGTKSLFDPCHGNCVPEVNLLGGIGDLLFFSVEGHILYQLWRSDGTPEGTFRLTPEPVQAGLDLFAEGYNWVFFQGALYFVGCADSSGCALWKSDGTVGGTVQLKEFGRDRSPYLPRVIGNRLYFTVGDKAGEIWLWSSDGTAAGTAEVKALGKGFPQWLAASDGKLFLNLRNEDEHVDEIWFSDGTPAGTRLAASFQDIQGDFLSAGGRVYFVANNGTFDYELWVSDGSANGTRRITGFGPSFPSISQLTPAGNRVVFQADDGLHGIRLWSTAGTLESTAALPVPFPCPSCHNGTKLVPLGNRVLFFTDDGAHGWEPWITDGTAAGSRLVADVCPGACGASPFGPTPMLRISQGVLFTAAEGAELWRTDGTAAGTVRLVRLEGETRIRTHSSPDPFEIDAAVLASRVYFGTFAGPGPALWVNEGPDSSRLLTFPGPVGPSSFPDDLAAAGDRLVFVASPDGRRSLLYGTRGTPDTTLSLGMEAGETFPPTWEPTPAGNLVFLRRETSRDEGSLWRTDGTAAGTFQLGALASPGLAEWQGKLFFPYHRDHTTNLEIWRSDGSQAGTVKALEVPRELFWQELANLTGLGPELYFTVDSEGGGDNVQQVWRSDGTQAGTRMLTELFSFPAPVPDFVRLGSSVFFLGVDGEIWKTDGTPAGTSRLLQLAPDGGALRARELTVFQGALYFFARTNGNFRALWRSDGTPAGTVPLKEFRFFNSEDTTATGLIVGADRLWFAADDDVHGTELWTSDGTAAGTVLVEDIHPGPESSSPSGLLFAGSQFFFSADDGLHGNELWTSDAAAAGARMVQDIAPFASSSSPMQLTLAGGRLYFSATDGVTGRELWSLSLDGGAPCQPGDFTLCLNGGRFRVEARWRDFEGNAGSAHAVSLSGDTGYFWFFDPANVELILKVLDGQGLNQHHWVFYGALSSVEYVITVTDTQTGLTRQYVNPPGQLASVGDTKSFGPLGAHSTTTPVDSPPALRKTGVAAAAVCEPSPERLCLRNGRFAVEATWKDFQGKTGKGKAVSLTGDTGYFWFFDAANVEVVLKVLDGTALNGKHWVFYGALSNVEYTIKVTDTLTGQTNTYTNPSGRFASVADTGAF